VITQGAATLVVIVNYRAAALVVECLRALAPQMAKHPHSRVVVIDNRSEDAGATLIAGEIAQAGWSAWAEVREAPCNGGFAYGNNLAVRTALAQSSKPDFVWLLNPDTVPRAGALDALVDFLHRHPQAGIAGSGLDEGDGQPWPYAFGFPSIASEVDGGLRLGLVTRLLRRFVVLRRMDQHQPTRVDWLPGASMMVRREVFEQIGLMDEDYFLYFEETDFCLQAHRVGWQCWYVPQSRVIHIAGQSTGVTSKQDQPRRLPAYWFESRRRYFVKNHGRPYAMATDALWVLSHLLWRARRALQRKPDTDPPQLLRDFLRHSAWVHAALPVNPARH
jgi:N-acetylglucosaminyl-diphospho-decaprenol L-rhamnosyltransferase